MNGVTVARTVEEAESLRPVWERLQGPSLAADPDYFLTHVRHAQTIVRPHVVGGEEGGRPAALIVARIDDTRLAARVGHMALLRPRVRALTVVSGGVGGPLAERDPAAVVGALTRSVEPGEVGVVRLRTLELGSPLHAAARAAAPVHRREHFGRPAVHWRSELPATKDEFLARRSKRRRESVRRYARRLEKAYGDRLRVELVRTRAGLERLLADSLEVHRKTYQAALHVGLSADGVHRRLAELAADRGWFRGYLLYVDDRPVAFWHGNAYRGTFGIGATGFDPAFAQDRPGTYLFMCMVEDLCADDAVRALDFGIGDAEYKQHFGDESTLEEEVLLYAATPRAVSVGLTRSALAGATAAAATVLERAGRLGKLRRRYRARLEQRQGG
ncbi:MAG TPA: GNAT family N-acetyltransferase [Gaiellaceae bacterium]|nr:GNAT family N-acetyltransferase [Gaiellaceae bacterium]